MKSIPFGLILFFSVCFVGFGDQVLPHSVGQYSTSIRSGFDNLMISAFPQLRPKTNPYGRTEEAIRETEKR